MESPSVSAASPSEPPVDPADRPHVVGPSGSVHPPAPHTATLPDSGDRPLVVLVDAPSVLERRLVDRWLAAARWRRFPPRANSSPPG